MSTQWAPVGQSEVVAQDWPQKGEKSEVPAQGWTRTVPAEQVGRGALGYQKALLTAYGATIPGYFQGDMTEVPFVDAEIARHWLNLPST
jgi:hypothetical protein